MTERKPFSQRLPNLQKMINKRLRWREEAAKTKKIPLPSKPAILLVGRTGVGKSALINAIFESDVAKSGHGLPITEGFSAYGDESIPITMYDSPGWEGGADKEAEFRKSLKSFFRKNKIDAVWFAIDAPGARFTDFDVHLLKRTFRKYPTLIILTKCDIASDEQIIDLMRAIAVANVPVEDILQVSASPILELISSEEKRFSPQELVQKTLALLPS